MPEGDAGLGEAEGCAASPSIEETNDVVFSKMIWVLSALMIDKFNAFSAELEGEMLITLVGPNDEVAHMPPTGAGTASVFQRF